MAIEVGAAYVSILPSAKGFSAALLKQIRADLRGAGDAAGQDFSESFNDAADDAGKGIQDQVKKNTRGVGGEGEKAGKSFGAKLAAGAKSVAGPLIVGFVGGLGAEALKGLVGGMVNAASEAEQSQGAVTAIFKDNAKQIETAAGRAAQAVGLSANEYRGLASTLGAQLKNKGITDFADQTEGLITLGADLSAQFGGSTKDAVEALTSALRGETDPIERYGVSLNAAAVEQQALSMGMKKVGGQFTDQEKALASLALIQKQTADAQGTFNREQDTYAGKMQRAQASAENLKTTIGQFLLPIFTKIADVLNSTVVPAIQGFVESFQDGTGAGGQFKDVLTTVKDILSGSIDFYKDNKTWIDAMVVAIVSGTVAYKALTAAQVIQTGVTKAWSLATGKTTLAQLGLNTALLANPIGIVVIAIGALVGALIYLYNNNETVRNGIDKAWATIKGAISSVVGWVIDTAVPGIVSAWNTMVTGLGKAKDGIESTWNQIKDVVRRPIEFVVNTVIRDGVVRAWNAVAEKLSLPTWDFKGFARGGWTGPGQKYTPAGVVHADEFVIRKEARSKFERENPGTLDFINRYGVMPGYAGGGQVWSSMWDWARKNLPGMQLTSSVRNSNDFHGAGKAIDIAAPMNDQGKAAMLAAARAIAATFGGAVLELIHTPAGPGLQLKRGQPINYGADTLNQHYCVPLDVPVLTQRGWLTYDEVRPGDLTLGLNWETGETEWTEITDVNVFDDAEVFETGTRGWRVRATANHRWIARSSRTGALAWQETQNATADTSWLVAAPYEGGEGLPITADEAELLGWLFTDGSQWSSTASCEFYGCANPARSRGLCGSHRRQADRGIPLRPLRKYPRAAADDTSMFVWQTKPEGVERLGVLLGDNASWNGKGYRLRGSYAGDLLSRAGITHVKDASELTTAALRMDRGQLLALYGGILGGDGLTSNGRDRVYQTRGPAAQLVALVGYLLGYRPNIADRDPGPCYGGAYERNGQPTQVNMCRPVASTYRRGLTPVGRQRVWCPTTRNHSWTADFGNGAVLTGNSHVHWAMDQFTDEMAGLDIGEGGFKIGNPVAEVLKKLASAPFDLASGGIDRIAGLFPESEWRDMSVAFAKKPVEQVKTFITDMIDKVFPPMSFGGGGESWSGNVSSWSEMVSGALSMLGQPQSLVGTVLRRMNQESGGNPRAINQWDCLPVRTRILTRRGWLTHDQVREGDETIGYDPRTGKSVWTKITRVVHHDNADIIRIGGKRWAVESTPNHRWLVEKRNGSRAMVPADEMAVNDSILLSVPAETGDGLPITDTEAALLGWIAGDGHVESGRRGPSISVAQAKREHFEAVDAAFLETPHAHYAYPGRTSCATWRMTPEAARDLMARVGHPKEDALAIVLAMSTSQRTAWLGAMIRAEGTRSGGYTVVYQCEGPVRDALKVAIYMSGRRPSESLLTGKEQWRDCWAHGLTRPRLSGYARSITAGESQDVWCVTTELGTWTAEQDGQVFLTGNSNAANGIPSKGLMQVIDPTFRAYALPGYNRDIYDPMSNILASMRYAIARYGSLSAAYDRQGGYAEGGRVQGPFLFDSGGYLPTGLSLVANHTGRPERILNPEQEAAMAARGGDTYNISTIDRDNIGEIVQALDFASRKARLSRRARGR